MSASHSPRFLLICADPSVKARLGETLASSWPEAELRHHDPKAAGRLPVGFVAAGFDALLLALAEDRAARVDWLRDLADRAEFAPVIVFGGDATETRIEALEMHRLAADTLPSGPLIDLLREVSRRRRVERSLQRSRANADAKYRFGNITIRGHRPLRLIARGGASSVHLAESERLGDIVALKVLDRVPDATGDLRDFERFLDEYQILASLDHPNVVRIHDIGVADDHLFIAMEYFAAGSLRTKMREAVPAREALGIAASIARALETVHAVGILHRDLKPGNVMIRDDGSIALIDFGLADVVDASVPGVGRILGTPEYMSPEQGHGEPLDARSDLYSLGIVLYEMIVGQRPFRGDTPFAVLYQQRNAPLPRLPQHLASLTPLLERLLAKRPGDRFANAAAAAAAIEHNADLIAAAGTS
jgi:hypothetical protein